MVFSAPCADRTPDVLALYALYDAFNARAVEQILARLAPDVVWTDWLGGGQLHGHAALADHWHGQFLALDPQAAVRGIAIEDDGRLTVSVHLVVRARDGTILGDGAVTHRYRMGDGKVFSMVAVGG
ncbi:nuclear transport factor 2 family protein [Zavarzinia sp. CC-PAN008]|uniref:nuclear transport factor 2 family protein n=1 Tax=Zavarzinia sp. CC-PAN008 TaxID=3243332 RepID=UPI003F7491A1